MFFIGPQSSSQGASNTGPQSSSQGASNTFTSFGDVISSRYMTK